MQRILWQVDNWSDALNRVANELEDGDVVVVPTYERLEEVTPILSLLKASFTAVVDGPACAAEKERVMEIRSHAKTISFTDEGGARGLRMTGRKEAMGNAFALSYGDLPAGVPLQGLRPVPLPGDSGRTTQFVGDFSDGEMRLGDAALPARPAPEEPEEELPPEDPHADPGRFNVAGTRTGRMSSSSPNQSGTPWWKNNFLALDTETAGLHGDTFRLFALGGILYEMRQPVREHALLFNPADQPVLDLVLRVNAALIKEQKEPPPLFSDNEQQVKNILMYSKVWVSHNTPFDLDVMQREFMEGQFELPQWIEDNQVLVLDTRALIAWALRKETPRPNISMRAALARYDIPVAPAYTDGHAVLGDAEHAARLLLALMPDLPDDLGEMRRHQEEANRYLAEAYPPCTKLRHTLKAR